MPHARGLKFGDRQYPNNFFAQWKAVGWATPSKQFIGELDALQCQSANTAMAIKKLLFAMIICVLFFGKSFFAIAQQPENLRWVPMTWVAFNAPGIDDLPPVQQSITDLARVIWNREISAFLNQTVQNKGRLFLLVLSVFSGTHVATRITATTKKFVKK